MGERSSSILDSGDKQGFLQVHAHLDAEQSRDNYGKCIHNFPPYSETFDSSVRRMERQNGFEGFEGFEGFQAGKGDTGPIKEISEAIPR